MSVLLGVNIDHVATLRQARRECDPDPVLAAQISLAAGANSIVAHLREDRRHIQDRDIALLRKVIKGKFNLEMSLNPKIVSIALAIRPEQVTLVPERRQEVTTEGGLDVFKASARLKKIRNQFKEKNIEISLFIDPNKRQIDATVALGVKVIEFHTGVYAQAFNDRQGKKYLQQLVQLTSYARQRGLTVNLGHGLNYENTYAIAKIPGIHELNIGHAIVSRAVFVGFERAVKEMLAIMKAR